MKECAVQMIGMPCSSLSEESCMFVRNDGFGDGEISIFKDQIDSISTDGLWLRLGEIEGRYKNSCKAAPVIRKLIGDELKRRLAIVGREKI